jgi:hypothetical protein
MARHNLHQIRFCTRISQAVGAVQSHGLANERGGIQLRDEGVRSKTQGVARLRSLDRSP